MPPSRGVLVQCAWLAAAACAWLAVGATGGGGRPLVVLARGAQAEVRALKGEERAGAHYEHMASQFRKAEQVAAQELADAHRKGPIDTLRTASERLDVARGALSHSAANRRAMLRLSKALRAYSRALIRNKDGLEFESPGAYKQLSAFEIKHPSLARVRTPRARDDEVLSASLEAASHAREAQRLERRAASRGRQGQSERERAHQGLAAPMSQLERDVALARKEMQSIEAKGGPRQPLFPAFAGRAVKGFPYNVMGNLMSAVNAV